jgi:hypothetical protein
MFQIYACMREYLGSVIIRCTELVVLCFGLVVCGDLGAGVQLVLLSACACEAFNSPLE